MAWRRSSHLCGAGRLQIRADPIGILHSIRRAGTSLSAYPGLPDHTATSSVRIEVPSGQILRLLLCPTAPVGSVRVVSAHYPPALGALDAGVFRDARQEKRCWDRADDHVGPQQIGRVQPAVPIVGGARFYIDAYLGVGEDQQNPQPERITDMDVLTYAFQERLTREELLQADRDYLWHPWSPAYQWHGQQLIFVEGDGCYVTDIDGHRYLDAKGAVLNASCGYGRREIIRAVEAQMSTLMNCDLASTSNIPAILLARKYAELMPGDLTRTFFCTSGSEANEAAIKMARMYHMLRGEPHRRIVVSLRDGYHGATLGALSLSGTPFTQEGNKPLPPGFISIPTPRCINCANHVQHMRCELPTADELVTVIEQYGPETIAAFIMEPILGVAGVVIPPPGYMRRIREICDQYGVLLIVDEVMTGFGRTGLLFGFQHEQLIPDIVTTSKGVSGGYIPLSAITTTDSIYRVFYDDRLLNGFRHGHTNSGHATACAAALATIDVIEREHLVENAADVGAALLEQLQSLRQFDFVLDVRGKGLLVGIEVEEGNCQGGIARHALNFGLIVRQQGPVISLVPPLILSHEQAMTIATILHQACEAFIQDLRA